MARTERQIAEFMEYYSTAPKDERTWALNHIAQQEGKSPAEIRAIYEKFKGNVNLKKGVKAPEEFIGSIQKALFEGYSEPQIISMYGTSSTIVQRARNQMKDREPVQLVAAVKSAEQKQLDALEAEFEKHVDELEKKLVEQKPAPPRTSEDFEVERDIKVYLPHETEKTPSVPAVDLKEVSRRLEMFNIKTARELKSDNLWKALSEQLADFAVGTFGSGTKLNGVSWNNWKEKAKVEIVTADGRIICLTLEEIGHE